MLYQSNVPGWAFTDLDKQSNFMILAMFRLFCAVFMSRNNMHPDEYWQVTQPAYNWVYGGVSLPWEFTDEYKLRNVLYPAYTAIPLYVMKLLGLDSHTVVMLSPYLAHWVLVVAGDYFFYQIGKKTVGVNGTRIGVFVNVFNGFQGNYLHRCFTNSLE